MNLSSKPLIANDLIWRLLDDNVVVVSPRVGEVRVLNGIGSAIWQLLVDDYSPDEIEEYLVKNYEVSRNVAQSDLNTFISDLTERGILVREAEHQS